MSNLDSQQVRTTIDSNIVVITTQEGNQITIEQPKPSSVEVTSVGLQGPQGPPGDSLISTEGLVTGITSDSPNTLTLEFGNGISETVDLNISITDLGKSSSPPPSLPTGVPSPILTVENTELGYFANEILPISGSGIRLSSEPPPSDPYHFFLGLGGIDIIHYSSSASAVAGEKTYFRTPGDFVLRTGERGGDYFSTDNLLLEHTHTNFKLYTSGSDDPKIAISSQSIALGDPTTTSPLSTISLTAGVISLNGSGDGIVLRNQTSLKIGVSKDYIGEDTPRIVPSPFYYIPYTISEPSYSTPGIIRFRPSTDFLLSSASLGQTLNGNLSINGTLSLPGISNISQSIYQATLGTEFSVSASYASSSTSASYSEVALSSSYASNALSASYSINSTSASYASSSTSASYANIAFSSSYASSSTSASYTQNSLSASYSQNSSTASFALTALYADNALATFPYTGSAIISGSLDVTGSLSSTGVVYAPVVSSSRFIGDGKDLYNLPVPLDWDGNTFLGTLNIPQLASYQVAQNLLQDYYIPTASLIFSDGDINPIDQPIIPFLQVGNTPISTFSSLLGPCIIFSGSGFNINPTFETLDNVKIIDLEPHSIEETDLGGHVILGTTLLGLIKDALLTYKDDIDFNEGDKNYQVYDLYDLIPLTGLGSIPTPLVRFSYTTSPFSTVSEIGTKFNLNFDLFNQVVTERGVYVIGSNEFILLDSNESIIFQSSTPYIIYESLKTKLDTTFSSSVDIEQNLRVQGSITGSIISASTYYGDGSNLLGLSVFPYTGSAGITGSLVLTGSLNQTGGDVYLKDLPVGSQLHVVTYNNITGQLFITGANALGGATGGGTPNGPFNSIQFNDDGVLNGDANLTFDPSILQLRITSSLLLSGSQTMTGTLSLPGISNVSESIANLVENGIGFVPNLTKDLEARHITSSNISSSGYVSASYFVGNGSSLTGINTGSWSGNLTGNATISGDVAIGGKLSVNGGITGSLKGTATTASYVETAQTASYVTLAQTASYVETAQTASYVETAQTASYIETAQTASYVTLAQTASYVENAISASYSEVAFSASYASNSTSASYAITSSYSTNSTSASYSHTASYVETAQTASYILASNISQPFTSITASIISASGVLSIGGISDVSASIAAASETVAGFIPSLTKDIIAQNITASQNISASGYVSASYFIGNGSFLTGIGDEPFPYTGNAIIDGVLAVSGDLGIGGISNVSQSIYQAALSSSYAKTASYVENAQTASYVENAQTASYVTLAQTASYVENAQTASFISLPDIYIDYTSGEGQNEITLFKDKLELGDNSTPEFGSISVNSVYTNLISSEGPGGVVLLGSSSYASTASYVENAQTASYVENAQTASYVETAQTASYITLAQTASYVETAQTASYVTLAQTASYIENAQTASYLNITDLSIGGNLSIGGISNVSASIALAAGSGGGFTPSLTTDLIARNITANGFITSSDLETGDITTKGTVQLKNISDTTPQNHILTYDTSTGQVYITSSTAFGFGTGGGEPGGVNTSIQYNDAGAFGGSNAFTITDESTRVDITVTGSIIASEKVYADDFVLTGTGMPTITSNTNLILSASNAIEIRSPFLRFKPTTTGSAEAQGASPGDVIYDSEQDKFFGKTSAGWVAFH